MLAHKTRCKLRMHNGRECVYFPWLFFFNMKHLITSCVYVIIKKVNFISFFNKCERLSKIYQSINGGIKILSTLAGWLFDVKTY